MIWGRDTRVQCYTPHRPTESRTAPVGPPAPCPCAPRGPVQTTFLAKPLRPVSSLPPAQFLQTSNSNDRDSPPPPRACPLHTHTRPRPLPSELSRAFPRAPLPSLQPPPATPLPPVCFSYLSLPANPSPPTPICQHRTSPAPSTYFAPHWSAFWLTFLSLTWLWLYANTAPRGFSIQEGTKRQNKRQGTTFFPGGPLLQERRSPVSHNHPPFHTSVCRSASLAALSSALLHDVPIPSHAAYQPRVASKEQPSAR